jgi:hypothetical protein
LEDAFFQETGRELYHPTPTPQTLALGYGDRAGMRICPNPEPILLNVALQGHQPFSPPKAPPEVPPEAKLVVVPISEAVQMGAIHTQDNESHDGLQRRIQKYKLGLVSLGLVAAAAIIAVAIVLVTVNRNKQTESNANTDPVIMASTTSTSFLTSTTSTATPVTRPVAATNTFMTSMTSTTSPQINTVSGKLTV